MKKLVMVCLSIIVSGCNFEYNPLGHGDEVVNRDGAPGELNTPAPQGGVDIGEFLIDNVSSTTGAQERLTGSCITGQDVVLTSDDLNPNPQLYPCPSNGKIDTLVTFKTGISKTVTIIASTEGEPDIPIIIIVDTQGPDPLVVTAPADDSTTPENPRNFCGDL